MSHDTKNDNIDAQNDSAALYARELITAIENYHRIHNVMPPGRLNTQIMKEDGFIDFMLACNRYRAAVSGIAGVMDFDKSGSGTYTLSHPKYNLDEVKMSASRLVTRNTIIMTHDTWLPRDYQVIGSLHLQAPENAEIIFIILPELRDKLIAHIKKNPHVHETWCKAAGIIREPRLCVRPESKGLIQRTGYGWIDHRGDSDEREYHVRCL
jgi:hypothetical protein